MLRALRELKHEEGKLIRLGYRIYGRAGNSSPDHQASRCSLAQAMGSARCHAQALNKLKATLGTGQQPSVTTNEGRSTQVPMTPAGAVCVGAVSDRASSYKDVELAC